LIEKFGTDALRMSLVVGNTPGTSLPLDENKIKGYRNFANKIWNATRFVMLQTENSKSEAPNPKQKLNSKDKKYLTEFKKVIKSVTKEMDSYRFYSASEKIYHYFWHTFCDKIIEEYKLGKISQYVLIEILTGSIKLLHPFMPFITEEIYQKISLKDKKSCIMIEKWPS
jgi:valyl-tRNA synthetase